MKRRTLYVAAPLSKMKAGDPYHQIDLDEHTIVTYNVHTNDFTISDEKKRWKPFVVQNDMGKEILAALDLPDEVRCVSSWDMLHPHTEYQVKYKLVSDTDPGLSPDGKDLPFIRLFKDETNETLWDSYCSALGVKEDPQSIKSLRVYFTGAKPDTYNDAGEMINL